MYKIEGPTSPGSMEVSEAHTVHLCQFIHCFHKLAELGQTCLLFGVARRHLLNVLPNSLVKLIWTSDFPLRSFDSNTLGAAGNEGFVRKALKLLHATLECTPALQARMSSHFADAERVTGSTISFFGK